MPKENEINQRIPEILSAKKKHWYWSYNNPLERMIKLICFDSLIISFSCGRKAMNTN